MVIKHNETKEQLIGVVKAQDFEEAAEILFEELDEPGSYSFFSFDHAVYHTAKHQLMNEIGSSSFTVQVLDLTDDLF